MPEINMNDEQIKHIGMIYRLFELSEDGKKFLTDMKKMLGECAPFPMAYDPISGASSLAQYGNSVEVYAGFKSGQLNLIKYIEASILSYQNILSTKTPKEQDYAE